MPLSPDVLARATLRVGDHTLPGDALLRRARAHLGALHALGVAAGDRVAVWADGSPTCAVALAAHALGGVVSVPLNPSAGAKELAHVVSDAAPALVVGDIPEGRVEVPVMALGEGPLAALRDLDDDHRPALVLYTSGTTGAPKGAVLTRANLASNLDALALAWDWTPDDALVHALPLFHVHGLALGLLGPLRLGGRVRVLPRFDPDALADALADATMLFAVPTMYHRLTEHPAPALTVALARARLLVSGSAPLPVREHARLRERTGRGVVERYGLTETLINTSVRARDGARPGTVGAALDGVSLRLVDDRRAPLEVDDDATLGEVAVRGPNVFAGYLHRPDATSAARDDEGWFYTGDLAARAPDGAVRIVGRRATDLIKTGGYKVGAGEVEAALLEHPAVREAAVRGVADDDLGERIEAWVVLRPEVPCALASLSDHVASLIAWHKRPRVVHAVESLPRNAMGKVVKSRLGSP